MTKKEFMEELEILLSSLPREEREDVLRYYDSYFEDAGVEYEQIVIKELGSAGRVAAQILKEFQQEKSEGIYTERGYQEREDKKETPIRYEKGKEKEKQERESSYHSTKREETRNDSELHASKKKLNKSLGILLVILAIFTFPIWISVLGAVFGTLFGICVALLGTVVGLGIAGIVCVVAGIAVFFVGIIKCFALPIIGLVFIALSLVVFGLGCLLVVGTMACMKLAIWLGKTIGRFLQQLLQGRKGAVV